MLVVRQEREHRLVRLSGCCICLAFFSLVLAAMLPMFVVTSVKGSAKFAVYEAHVDVAVGDGLWKKNVCFGSTKPDEQFLQSLGLTCQGSLQTAHCDEDGLNQKAQDRCDDYLLMQGMASLAIFATFVATFIGALARGCSKLPVLGVSMRFGTIVSLALALTAASTVIKLVKQSDMVDERTFDCTTVMGIQLCHGYGPSFGLQWAGVAELGIALLINVLLLCLAPTQSTTTTYEYVRVPLLQPVTQSSGVVIHAPQPSQGLQQQQAVQSL